MTQGWVKIQRSVTDSWIYKSKPFCQFAAWVDLILLVNHEEKKIPVNGKMITIQRGQTYTSIRSLAERWGWSLSRVKRYIDVLEMDNMVNTEKNANGTLLTLVNYSLYQDAQNANETETERKRNANETRAERNKNIKNEKNDKEDKKDIYISSIDDIFSYLNLRTGKHFTGRSEAQRKHIIARLKEGYTVEEFKQVIDNKVAAWGHSEKMAVYLRPETLFGTKFETYLNDVETERQKARREDHELHEKQVAAIRDAANFDVGFLK